VVDLDTVADVRFAVPGAVAALLVEDLDGDCVPEVVVGTDQALVVGHLDASGFTEAFTAPGPVKALAAGDFDGDGTTDLVVGGGAEVRWLRGPVDAARAADPVLLRSAQHPTDDLGAALSSNDADGDGTWELAVGAPEWLVPCDDPDGGCPPEGALVQGGAVWWLVDGLPTP
jgi:hypothetical protein